MKKRKSNNKVLVVAIVLALVIVIGATFAWYTSKDEVTNKISASNDFNVSITETYTPETTWTPGEEVNKDVAIVNTGSVPAFVRAYVDGQFVVTKLKEETFSDELDPTKEYVKLGSTDPNNSEENVLITMRKEAFKTEVGGYLVYAAGVPVEGVCNSPLGVERNAEIDLNTNGWVKFDALTHEDDADYVSNESTVAELIGESGYYVFARAQEVIDDGEITTEYVFDGYYFDEYSGEYYKIKLSDDGDDLDFFTKEGVAPTEMTARLYTTEKKVVNTSADSVTAEYVAAVDATQTEPAKPAMIKITYNGDDADKTNDDIIINIKLINLGAEEDQWTAIDTTADAKALTFYYNSILDGGKTTSNFIDAVELDSSVGDEAFLAMDYYLNVHSDSIQAIVDKTKYANTSVEKGDEWGEVPKQDGVEIATNAKCTTTGVYETVKNSAITWAKATAASTPGGSEP